MSKNEQTYISKTQEAHLYQLKFSAGSTIVSNLIGKHLQEDTAKQKQDAAKQKHTKARQDKHEEKREKIKVYVLTKLLFDLFLGFFIRFITRFRLDIRNRILH